MDANARRYDGAPDVQKWTRPVRERERTLPQGMLTLLSHREINHIDMLHEVTQEQMADLMDRYVGRDWEQRYDALAAERDRQQQVVYDEDAHGLWSNESAWAGVRRTDDDTSAAGVYGFFEDREGKRRLQFRPIMADLDHEEAEIVAEYIRERLKAEAREIERNGDPAPTLDINF